MARVSRFKRHLCLMGAAVCLAVAGPVLPTFAQATTAPQQCQARLQPGPLTWRMEHLEAAKSAIDAGKRDIQPAYQLLLSEADAALQRGPYTVTDKTRLPPSGDVHDYTSLAPYWWPDPKSKDGTPYIRKDGQINPQRESTDFDRRRSQNMVDDVWTLALASYFSDEAAYGVKAEELLNVWFVDPATRMNPNLKFGQSIPGRTDGRGIGIIDTSFYVDVVNAARLLHAEGELSDNVYLGLQRWFADYTKWLVTSDLGQDERGKLNNHGTYYDMQVVSFALFVGDCAFAERILEDTKQRISSQIMPDGRMPLEEERTRSLHYYVFNLQAFLQLARLGEPLGINLYTYQGEKGGTVLKTLQKISAYLGKEDSWPHEQIGASSDKDLWRVTRYALTAVETPKILAAEKRASGRDKSDRIWLLTYPLVP